MAKKGREAVGRTEGELAPLPPPAARNLPPRPASQNNHKAIAHLITIRIPMGTSHEARAPAIVDLCGSNWLTIVLR